MTSKRSKSFLRGKVEFALDWTIRGFLALWILFVIGVVAAFVTPPGDDLHAADWQLDGGAVDTFEIGQPRMIQGGPQPVWVARLDADTFTALAAVCETRHCVLRWNPALRVFSCPCHHATYDLEGRYVDGPLHQSLRSFFVRVKAGRVRVHLRRVLENGADRVDQGDQV